jgi:hypothetical protein
LQANIELLLQPQYRHCYQLANGLTTNLVSPEMTESHRTRPTMMPHITPNNNTKRHMLVAGAGYASAPV